MLQMLGEHSRCYALGYTQQLTPSCGLPPPEDKNHVFRGQELKLSNGIVLKLEETLYRQHAIIGRGTTTVIAKVQNYRHFKGLKANDHAIWKGEVVIKFSWPAKAEFLRLLLSMMHVV